MAVKIEQGRSHFHIQRSVIFALFLRELKTRFGQYRLGYLWALLEPGGYLAFFALLHGSRSNPALPGVDFPVFIVLGFAPFLLVRSLIQRSMAAFTANQGLMGYRQVVPIDIILARALLETMVYASATFVLLGLLATFDMHIWPNDLPLVLFWFAVLLLFGLGLSLIFCVLAELVEEVQKLWGILSMPLMILSGAFFPLHLVPPEYKAFFTWNPFVHGLEMSRAAYFEGYPLDAAVDPGYILMATLISLVLGLVLYRGWQERLLASS